MNESQIGDAKKHTQKGCTKWLEEWLDTEQQKNLPLILVTESKHHARYVVMLLLQQPSFLLPCELAAAIGAAQLLLMGLPWSWLLHWRASPPLSQIAM